MNWKPNEEEAKYLNLILSMCVNCKLGNGVYKRETFVINLNMISDSISELPKTKEKDK